MLDRLAGLLLWSGRVRRFDVDAAPADVLLQSPLVLRGLAVTRLLDEVARRAIVHVGLAGGRARIALERLAVNVMDFEIADNAGYRAAGEACMPGGPVAYFSTLPLGAILDALVAEGVPA